MTSNRSVDAVSRLLSRPSGPLGFGTGLLHFVKEPRSAVELLRKAHEEGVTYFDTARLYGEGRCEAMVGEAFAHMRDEVLIATKVGILPSASDFYTRARGKARALLRRIPPLRAIVPPPTVRFPEFFVFDRQRMQQSLETSLRELRTDHVDVLLLHECKPEHVQSEEVCDFLDQMVREGKTRTYGIAPEAGAMQAIAASGAAYGEVAQFDASLRPGMPPPAVSGPALVVTHSCLGQRFQDQLARLKADATLKERWSCALGIDAADPSALAQAYLAHAIQQNAGGLVLFSTTRPERLKSNLHAPAWLNSPERAAALARLMAEG
jgi:aryl-alcohol dehydrogenase-like predicted oxidoreductase